MPLENSSSGLDGQTQRRRHIMEILAKADDSRLESAWEEWPDKPDVFAVRGPETGLVMIRGRIGGGGAPFNLGEASISRATIRLDTGEIGVGQTLGLTPRKAELAAIFDALGQRPESRDAVDALAAGIEREIAEADETSRRETAATRVDFFTMVRGED
jgi:alpha-D-ribose 1-methylphosphonate 5-triphosphate synthase subunit PhnG